MSLRSAAPALVAALLFGASTPLAKLLGGAMPPLLLAGLLYAGSGIGLDAILLVRRALQIRNAGTPALAIPRADWPWLLGAIAAGGVLGPALLMVGLASTDAASAFPPAHCSLPAHAFAGG
jgi:drug/metabolite transporter (DMT)-like permease